MVKIYYNQKYWKLLANSSMLMKVTIDCCKTIFPVARTFSSMFTQTFSQKFTALLKNEVSTLKVTFTSYLKPIRTKNSWKSFISMCLRVLVVLQSDLHSFLVNVYLLVCNMLWHFKVFLKRFTDSSESYYYLQGNRATEISRFWVKWPNFNNNT